MLYGMAIVIKTNLDCPLCRSSELNTNFFRDNSRNYYRCSICNLISVPPSQYISIDKEYTEYNKHSNSPEDHEYRKFLSRLFVPLNDLLTKGSSGLDFGSGPGPTLSVMFEEAGHQMNLYDPFYTPERHALSLRYDFITASEVIEHLHNPFKEFELLWSMLNPGGWLGIMTKLAIDEEAFSKWHYKDDLTHVCFFSKETMDWLAVKWKTKVHYFGKDVVLFQKS